MVQRISKTIFVAFIAATSLIAQGPKCNGASRECEQQIRQMLSGRRYLGATIEDRSPGLIIKAVHPDSPADRAGLEPGDRLMAINGKTLENATPREFKQHIADARSTGKLWMIVLRRGAYSRVETRLEPYTKEQIQRIVTAHLSQTHTSTAGAQ